LFQEDIWMYTSIMLVALSGLAASPVREATDSPWLTDYMTAYEKGQSEKKPLVLVFGKGADGAGLICKEGKLDKEAEDLLRSKYVCLYIDIDSQSGKPIAEGFKVASAPSLMLTDHSQHAIAVRHSGTVSQSDLVNGLKKYAEPGRTVRGTDTTLTTEVVAPTPPKTEVKTEVKSSAPATMAPLEPTTPSVPVSTPVATPVVATTSTPIVSGSIIEGSIVGGTVIPSSYPTSVVGSSPVVGSYIPSYSSSPSTIYSGGSVPSFAPTSVPSSGGFGQSFAPSYPSSMPSFGAFPSNCPNGRCGR
jgi:hypothetical protein